MCISQRTGQMCLILINMTCFCLPDCYFLKGGWGFYKRGSGMLGGGKINFFLSVKAGWGICFLRPVGSVFLLTSAFTFVKMDMRSQPLQEKSKWVKVSLTVRSLSTKKTKQSPVRETSQHFHSPWHHMNKVLAKWLNIPRSISFLSERYKRGNCGHSHHEICMIRNTVICSDGIGVHTAVLRLVTIRVNASLLIGALASLDEKQLGFSSQRVAFAPNERFHQLLDVDSAAVHAEHTPLLAVAENATRHTVPFSLASVGQFLHQGQHLFACTVPVNLHLKAKPFKDFIQIH